MIQNNIPLSTDHFYKFVALFGLLVAIFCYSFPVIFLKPYNEEIFKQNYIHSELGAEAGYLEGKINDIEKITSGSLKEISVEYFWHIDNDTTKFIRYYYSSKDATLNMKIKELNESYFDLAKALFKSKAIENYREVEQKNLDHNKVAMYILGSVATILAGVGAIKWMKFQQLLDKKLELEIKELEIKNDLTDKKA